MRVMRACTACCFQARVHASSPVRLLPPQLCGTCQAPIRGACGTLAYAALPLQQEILYRVHKAPKLYLVHRLDKLTSGLLLMAKNKTKAQELSAKIQDHNMKKTYLARVNGRFPECVTKREVCACFSAVGVGASTASHTTLCVYVRSTVAGWQGAAVSHG